MPLDVVRAFAPMLAAFLLSSCGGGGSNGADAAPDAGSDTDTGTDTDADAGPDGGDTDTGSAGCDEMVWERVNPVFTNHIYAIAAVDADTVFVFGEDGLSARWSDGGWEVADGMPSAVDFLDAVAFGAEEAWATGLNGTVHFDGDEWSLNFATLGSGNAIWGSAPDDIYSAGEAPIAHYDGEEWSAVDGGPDDTMQAIWGSGPEDVIAAGYSGLFRRTAAGWSATSEVDGYSFNDVWGAVPDDVFAATESPNGVCRYDGADWQCESPAPPLTTRYASVWADAEMGAFLGGWSDLSQGASLLHSDGGGWTPFERPPIGGINRVRGSADGALYLSSGAELLRHLDGTEGYERLNGAMATDLDAIERVAPEEILAAGNFGGVVRGWGDEWAFEAVPTPPEPRPLPVFRAIEATPGGTVYVGGSAPHLVRSDGAGWDAVDLGVGFVRDLWIDPEGAVYAVLVDTMQGSPAGQGSCLTQDMFGRVGGPIATLDGDMFVELPEQPPCEVLAVTGDGTGSLYAACGAGGVWRFDGAAWEDTGFPEGAEAIDLFGANGGPIYAATERGEVLRSGPTGWESLAVLGEVKDGYVSADGDLYVLAFDYGVTPSRVYRFDGAAWTSTHDLGITPCRVWASGPDDIYVAGTYTFGVWTVYWGALEHYDGTEWTNALYLDEIITAVTGTGPYDVSIFAPKGGAWHYGGGDWVSETSEIEGPVTAVAIGADGMQIAATPWGAVARRDAGGWNLEHEAPRCREIRGLWAAADDDVYAACDGGAVLHYDGDAWSEATKLPTDTLNAVWGSGPDDVFAAGNDGVIGHWDGEAWETTVLPLGSYDCYWTVNDLWGAAGDDVFFAGALASGGYCQDFPAIGHYDGAAWTVEEFEAGLPPTSVRGLSGDRVWAIGSNSSWTSLHMYDGVSWTVSSDVNIQYEGGLGALLPLSADELYAVGDDGRIVRGLCP